MEIKQQEYVLMKDSVVLLSPKFFQPLFLRSYSEKFKGRRLLDFPYTVIWTVKGWYSTNRNIGVFLRTAKGNERRCCCYWCIGFASSEVSKVTGLRTFIATVAAVNGICCAVLLKERQTLPCFMLKIPILLGHGKSPEILCSLLQQPL